ncbi:MAG: S8 family peptidase, partial [Bacteroidota bacterium]
HPDFFDAGGTRLRSLLEFTEGGGQVEWTKAQIDANPGGVTQRDGDGGQGHGTHVMGTAAGNGGFSASQTGIAPESDLVFVKGIRSPTSTGGFSDADVIAGVDYMFRAAGSQPAVVNLSLGGNFGPLDGTSLYEQSLSGLTGEGRVIVAAAGNSGFQLIHAGDQTQANVLNETLFFANDPSIALASMWYDSGTLTEFYIGAYTLDAFGELVYLGEVGVNAGQVLDGGNGQPLPFVVDGVTLGSVVIDAQTTQDPRNGDGNVIFGIFGDPQNGIDVSQTIWTILSVGPSGGRMDMWALSGSEFFGGVIGFPSINEMPGNTMMTMGSPSTARDVIAVGSYVTRNRWVDIDGVARDWLNPNPDRDPNSPPVIPAIGQRSYFSSLGPTRDGRVTPDIAAPGELIFSSMSSALNVGVGVQRHEILQGGGYKSLQGTSMASPHVAGTIALMLEVDPTLTPAEAREIIQATARSDGFTGSVPNNGVGAGKLDALDAVQETIRRNGGSGGGTSVAEAEPNNTIPTAQPLGGSTPITVAGSIESSDNGDVTVTYQGGVVDDFEDLFRVSTTTTGLTLTLSDYTQDLDLVLIEEDNGGLSIVDLSASVEATESISAPALAPGTYYVGVSFYDGEGQSGTSSYRLVVDGGSPVDAEDEATVASLTLHPTYPNPVSASTTIGFELPEAAPVQLVVYDMLGREVATVLDGPMNAGSHAMPFDASRLASGVYVYRLRAGDETRTRSFVVTR